MILHPVVRRTPRPLRRPAVRAVALLRAVLGFCGAVLVVAAGFCFMAFRPLPAALYLAGLSAALVLLVTRAGRRPRAAVRRRQRRLTPPGPALPSLLAAVPVLALANLCLGLLAGRALLAAGRPPPGSAGAYLAQPGAWLPMAIASYVYAPLAEEFGFRGWMQRPLERAIGAPAAVLATGLVFGAVHQGPAVNRVLTGVVFGAAVVITGSIWAGVLLHAGNNLLGAATLHLLPDEFASPGAGVRWVIGAVGETTMRVVPAVCLAVLVALALHLRRRTRRTARLT